MRRQTSSVVHPRQGRCLGLKALYKDRRQAWATLLDAIAHVRLSHDAIYDLCHDPNYRMRGSPVLLPLLMPTFDCMGLSAIWEPEVHS